eukprot:NODE_975_length_2816_cov_0.464851.p4 type:complete len:111 gc:universal NODE_975_length_2816_cov_0.464851:805-473(-)
MEMYLNDNQFTNVTIFDDSRMTDCYLDNNPLLQIINKLPFASKCGTTGLFNSSWDHQCILKSVSNQQTFATQLSFVTTLSNYQTTDAYHSITSEVLDASITLKTRKLFFI